MSELAHATGTVDERGRLVVPRAWRDTLGLTPGESVALATDGTEIRIVNARRQRAQIAARLRGSVTTGESVDDLIADRRAEAAREDQERRPS